jgi:hypothetical protein
LPVTSILKIDSLSRVNLAGVGFNTVQDRRMAGFCERTGGFRALLPPFASIRYENSERELVP